MYLNFDISFLFYTTIWTRDEKIHSFKWKGEIFGFPFASLLFRHKFWTANYLNFFRHTAHEYEYRDGEVLHNIQKKEAKCEELLRVENNLHKISVCCLSNVRCCANLYDATGGEFFFPNVILRDRKTFYLSLKKWLLFFFLFSFSDLLIYFMSHYSFQRNLFVGCGFHFE